MPKAATDPAQCRGTNAAATNGSALEVVKLSDVKRGFVLLPRRWVVERDCAWMSRFRRLARDQERLAKKRALPILSVL